MLLSFSLPSLFSHHLLNRRFLQFLFLLYTTLLTACAPQRFVKPLAKKEQALQLTLGGALFEYKHSTIPMPFLCVAWGYGIDSSLTGFGALNISSALYGNIQAELGATKGILMQNRWSPALSITPLLNVIYRNAEVRKVYPQLALNAWWEYGKRKHLIYFSLDNWFETAAVKANDKKQKTHVLYMPSIGHIYRHRQWELLLEAKVMAPNLSNEGLVIEYKTPLGTHGAFGVYIGCTRKF